MGGAQPQMQQAQAQQLAQAQQQMPQVARAAHTHPCQQVRQYQEYQQLVAAQQQALIPIMEKYRVDVYDAGHVHSYEVTWPQLEGKTTAQSFRDPAGIVYITEGNGGVPGTPATNTVRNCSTPAGRCRARGTGGAYGRFSAVDGKALTYEHVENPTGKVTDTWTITRGA